MKARGLIRLGLASVLVAGPAWAGTLTVRRVWPERIVYHPGETAVIDVAVGNASKTAAKGNVAMEIRWGLDAKAALPARAVTVPARGKATVRFTYPVPKGRKWGHEARATLTDPAGAVQASGREYFTVGDNPWEVGHYRTLFGIRGCKNSGRIDKVLLPRFRQQYITTIEAYSWQPSVFDNMSPQMSTWRSGQGGYREGKEDWQYLVRQAHAMGMAVVTYIQCISYGPVGLEFVRKHPDWLTYDKQGRPRGWFDVDKLAAVRAGSKKFIPDSGGFSTGSILPTQPQVADYWIREVIRSKEMFGWDGFRSDGNPGFTSGYDYTGTLREVKDRDAANAALLTKIRRELTRRYPDFRFGWNNVVAGYPREYYGRKELDVMVPGAYNLFEHFRSATHPTSVFHKWKKAVFYVQNETGAIRRRGGFSHVGWMPSNRYLEALMCACGSHTDSWGGSKQYGNYRRFEFRWAEFLWDPVLRYVRPGTEAVRVDGPKRVWWKGFVHRRDLPGGRTRVTVHLVNMPPTDDDGWADRAPAPAGGVRVTFQVPAGKKLLKLVAVSPDTPGDVVTLARHADGSVTLPPVTVWTFLVAEFGG